MALDLSPDQKACAPIFSTAAFIILRQLAASRRLRNRGIGVPSHTLCWQPLDRSPYRCRAGGDAANDGYLSLLYPVLVGQLHLDFCIFPLLLYIVSAGNIRSGIWWLSVCLLDPNNRLSSSHSPPDCTPVRQATRQEIPPAAAAWSTATTGTNVPRAVMMVGLGNRTLSGIMNLGSHYLLGQTRRRHSRISCTGKVPTQTLLHSRSWLAD